MAGRSLQSGLGYTTRRARWYSLAGAVDRLATVVAEEELAVEQLHGDDGEDEMEQYVHY